MQAVKYNHIIDGLVPIEGSAFRASNTTDAVPIGTSVWSEEARAAVRRFASHDDPVVIEGEPGTGKKFLARMIHKWSSRSEGPFVALKVGSSDYRTAHSVIFGTFDGSRDNGGEGGLLELAEGGTLYVGGLSSDLALSGDMARFIEDRSYHGAGPVRVILGWEFPSVVYRSSGGARRIRNGFDCETIHIPALRERSDDIAALAAQFIKERCEQLRKEQRSASSQVMEILRAYDWPRNVSELRTVVNLLINQSRPPSIDASLLPSYMLSAGVASAAGLPASGVDLPDEVKRLETELIRAALKESRGRQNKAAHLLRIKPTTLFMKLKRYGIAAESFK